MDASAILLPLPYEDAATPIRSRRLLVHVSASDEEARLVVRRSLVAERTLTSIQEESEDFDFLRQQYVTTWLAPDNPYLTTEQRDRLDERGLIPLHTLLRPKDILASVLSTAIPNADRPPHKGKVWVNDASWETPANWAQTRVTHIQLFGGKEVPKGVRQRLRISVRAEWELAVGDMLLVEGKPIGIVGRMSHEMPGAADLIVPRTVGARLGAQPGDTIELDVAKAVLRGAEMVQARAMGPYSLITKQPLGNFEPGQPVLVNQIGWLLSRGFDANVAELTSLKCDDLRNRSSLQKLWEAGTVTSSAIPEPGAPESLLVLQSELMALGLKVTLERTMRGVALSVCPASTEDILAWSGGQVRKPETINYRTLADEPGGLFCPQVFGSDRFARRRRFGHLVLPCQVVSYLWRVGKPSTLETILARPAKVIEKIIDHQTWIRREANEWAITPATDAPEADWLTGADAIEALLKAVPADRLPAALQGKPELLITTHVPVLPPEFRPLVLLDSGNFATADVNDLLRRIINRANRLAKLEELKAPPVILQSERRMLQQSYDELLANWHLPKKKAVIGDSDKRLVDILEMVSRRVLETGKKRVDWSGRARAVSSPAVAERHVMVPRAMYATLTLEPNRPVLLTNLEDPAGALVALLPRLHDDAVLAFPGAAFVQLGLHRDAEPIAVVYRPLGVEANREAEALLEGDPGPRVRIPEMDGWIDAADAPAVVSGLARAALTGTRIVLRSARGVMLGGPGPVDFAVDADLPLAQRAAQEVPAPAEEAHLPKTGNDRHGCGSK